MSIKKVADVSGKANLVVNALGSVASVFFPKISASVAMASSVLEQIAKIDDEVAKDAVFGLSKTAETLQELANKAKNGEEIDYKTLEVLSENVKSIDVSLDKFYKIVS